MGLRLARLKDWPTVRPTAIMKLMGKRTGLLKATQMVTAKATGSHLGLARR
jgi:hypothetical protein